MAQVPPALIESRAEYAIGSLILATRWLLRLKTLGIRGWHWDDWFSVSVFVWHSALFAMVEYLAVVGAPLGFTQEMREALTPEMRVQLEKGGQGHAVLIAFFLQLTRRTRMHTYVWATAGVAGACFIAACLTTFLHCLPIRRNWQILPDPSFECSAGVAQNIAIAAGNVLVDALLLVVPVRILRDVPLILWRRVGIIFLLSLGLFVMAMAVARCILSVDNGPGVAQSSVWVFREALVTHHLRHQCAHIDGPFPQRNVANALESEEELRVSKHRVWVVIQRVGCHSIRTQTGSGRLADYWERL
ncbi:uncharacterized protein F5Z01DRAFT_737190 [Emericellopsis atlantica]|uniref:Rhodopsin domain-containing protein n=1 Tax=Emericellopsis atlantica TaxID=2614577 RepID=A0A9P7ZLC1_9HYPO|nr:uncharacterized protein F5Z01DRAFT_737190 [Emericellopsis atlantica]KAG9253822.1 hypothetical protein F5Z01DRAFT_737190 [Emericellopsis atlantica]